MGNKQNNGSGQPYEEAFREVVAHRTMLRAYIDAIVHDPQLTEDTLSDVAIEISRSWGRYDKTKPFSPWARGVARRVALSNLRKNTRRPYMLDPQILGAVGSRIDSLGDEKQLAARKQALQRCLKKLSGVSHKLIHLRYFESLTYEEIAAVVNKSINTLYVTFSRIHTGLAQCVRSRNTVL